MTGGPAGGAESGVAAGRGIEGFFREDRGRLLAMLASRLGDLDLAEEVVSEAMAAALERWPVDGVPDRPLAWLLTTARRKAIDRIRRDRTHAARLAVLQVEADRAGPVPPTEPGDDIPDDRLQLFFTCCHPALPAAAHTALTLRFLAGFSTPEVARVDAAGELVLLADQDRGLWDADRIAEGRGLVLEALSGGAGPYAVQAAIAALHDEAADVATTDWPQVVALYDVLLRLTPSPVIELNRAVAVAMRDGPAAGLALVDQLREVAELRDHHPLHTARADLLRRLGRTAEAAVEFRRARDLAGNEADRAHLSRRLASLG